MAIAKAAGAKKAWQRLIGKTGYMGISLHSRNHQGEGLEAMVDWANQQGFKRFRICLSDTLIRFNYAQERGIPLQQAFAISTLAGDKWLEQNLPILDNLSMPYDVVRWSHWLTDHAQEVEENRRIFNSALETDPEFRQSIMEDVHAFSLRKNGHPETDTAKINTSIKYLIEELAVYSVILKELPATTIYPGKQLNCFAYLRDNKPSHLPSAISNTGFIRLAIHGTQADERHSSFSAQPIAANQKQPLVSALK